jgi:hypothetical protein
MKRYKIVSKIQVAVTGTRVNGTNSIDTIWTRDFGNIGGVGVTGEYQLWFDVSAVRRGKKGGRQYKRQYLLSFSLDELKAYPIRNLFMRPAVWLKDVKKK